MLKHKNIILKISIHHLNIRLQLFIDNLFHMYPMLTNCFANMSDQVIQIGILFTYFTVNFLLNPVTF